MSLNLFENLSELKEAAESDIKRFKNCKDKDNKQQYGSYIYHHLKQLGKLELTGQRNLVNNLLGLHNVANQDTDKYRNYRHQHTVCYKVEEGEDVHT